MDFTNPFSLLVKLKARDQVFYCSQSVIKVANDLELDVAPEELILFLKVFHGDVFEEVKTLTVAEQQQLIHVAQLCGISGEGPLLDAIFDGDPVIPWDIWEVVADYHGLNMHSPDDGIKLLAKRGLCCWLHMELEDAGVAVTQFNSDIQRVGHALLVKKFGPPKEKQELN